jgi:hypothetical protein
MSRAALLSTIAMIVLATIGTAQQPRKPAAGCDKIDVAANWYQRQSAWWALDTLHDWTDDSLRTALLHGAALLQPDSTERVPLQLGATVWNQSATPILVEPVGREIAPLRELLRTMAAKRTWPLRDLVGPAGVRAAWIVASGDSALTSMAMHRMMEAGPGAVSSTDVAVLEDWMRLRTGRKQIYGTQLEFARSSHNLTPEPTEDLAHVDLRRDAAALPPLAFAICRMSRLLPH